MARIRVAGLALALSLGVASVSLAQAPEKQHADHGKDRSGQVAGCGQRGGFQQLLKGIDLTAAQKDQLKQLRETQRTQFEKNRGELKKGDNKDRTQLSQADREKMRDQMK